MKNGRFGIMLAIVIVSMAIALLGFLGLIGCLELLVGHVDPIYLLSGVAGLVLAVLLYFGMPRIARL